MGLTRERLYRTQGLILHRTNFGEADRLLTVFTPQLGRLRLLAKGARKPKSRKSGHVEPFTHVNLLIARGRDLDIVSQAEVLEPFRVLREDLGRVSLAYYVGELVSSFTEEGDENLPLFELTLATLSRLCSASDLSLALRFFELRAMGLLGYQPELFFCVTCRAKLEPVANYYSSSSGGVVCASHGEGTGDAIPLALPVFKVLRFMQTRDWDQVAALRIKPNTHRELESVLQRYIVYVLERRLRSVEFVHRLRRETRPVWAATD